MAEAIITRRGITKGELTLLEDIIVSGSAVTQVDISGLNIGKGEEIVLVCDFVNTSGTSGSYFLFVNTNYTNTNYWKQYLFADSTSVVSARANNAQFAYCENGQKSYASSKIKLTNSGYLIYQSSSIREYSSVNPRIFEFYGTSTFTTTNITSIRISSEVANGIGIGSRFQLYKVGG